MEPAVVWFNKYLSNTWEILATLKQARRAGEFRILCTHPRTSYPGRAVSDDFEQEPVGLSDSDYIGYATDVARRHRVTLFLPGRNLSPILRAKNLFDDDGVQVLGAADAATVAVINDKAKVYAALLADGFDLPNYEVVNDVAEFDAAWQRLRAKHERLCYKPAVSVFGLGFHIVDELRTRLTGLKGEGLPIIGLNDAHARLTAKGRFRDLILMEYLPGPERSVDCLARDGELIRCIVRRKESEGQILEDNPAIVGIVRRLTEKFGLTNLFNIQFRDSGGRPYLLEINPRMSGGLPFSCQSGVILPLWAIRLALGTATAADVPHGKTGLWIPQPELVSSL